MTAKEPSAELFGAQRSVVTGSYALLAPSGFVASRLPGWENADCVVLAGPALGAQFSQLLITLHKDGQGRGNTGKSEFVVYVLEGSPSVALDARRHRLEAGDFVYIPPDKDTHFQGANARILIFQKKYKPITGTEPPKPVFGHQREVRGNPFLGHEGIRVQHLVPDSPAFDLAVNIITHQPGVVIPFIQTPAPEHGILMLQGQALFRIGAEYHPVQAGDSIWIAPYRPQWFLPMGKTPASYICYTPAGRDPL